MIALIKELDFEIGFTGNDRPGGGAMLRQVCGHIRGAATVAVHKVRRRFQHQWVPLRQDRRLGRHKLRPRRRRRAIQRQLMRTAGPAAVQPTRHLVGNHLRHVAIGCVLAAANAEKVASEPHDPVIARAG